MHGVHGTVPPAVGPIRAPHELLIFCHNSAGAKRERGWSHWAQAAFLAERFGFVTNPSGPASSRTTRLTRSRLSIRAETTSAPKAGLRRALESRIHPSLSALPRRRRPSRTGVRQPTRNGGPPTRVGSPAVARHIARWRSPGAGLLATTAAPG